MNNKLFFGSMLSVFCGLALPVSVTTTLAADNSAVVTGSRLSADLARADRGTRLEVRGAGSEGAQTLIGHDAAATYALPAGMTSMILTLSKIEILNHFDFVDADAAGKVTVSVSSAKLPYDSPDWREVVGAQAFDGRQLVPCDLGSVEARYVKIDFHTATAGRIGGFNLFGVSESQSAARAKFQVSLNTSASAPVEASFAFDPADPNAKVVADLGSAKSVDALTCSYEAPAGTLELYLVDNLTAQDRVRLNYVDAPSVQPVSNDHATAPSALVGQPAIYTVDTAAQPEGKVSTDLHNLSGRYLVAAFRPAVRHRYADGKDYGKNVVGKDVKDAKSAPVFPAFTAAAPAGFGNPGGVSNVPLLPPAVNAPPIGTNTP